MKEHEVNGETRVLCWPGKLLSEDDLRRHLTCQTEILLAAKTVVTPLALDHLRGKGVRIRREETSAGRPGSVSDRSAWGHAEERPDAFVNSVLEALRREGIELTPLPGATPLQWARALVGTQTSEVSKTTEVYAGGVVFCGDPGLVCCVANKVAGVRAVAVVNGAQAKRAKQTLAANLFAVEAAGRTFHELRQIVRAAVSPAACPPDVAKVLQELDGHAHR